MRALTLVVLLAALPLESIAGVQDCGVGVIDARALATLGSARAAQPVARELAATASPSVPHFEEGLILLRAEDAFVPYHRPLDLSGKSVRIRRLSASESRIETIPFTWNDSLGVLERRFTAQNSSLRLTLPFDFPFRERSVREVGISRENAIWLDGSAPSFSLDQWGELEILSLNEPVISPLLLGDGRPGFETTVFYVKSSATSVQFTFLATGPRGYETQATLEPNGDITFSWKNVTIAWGSPVISDGSSEPFRSDRRTLASASGPSGDATVGAGAVNAALDIVDVRMERIGSSPLIEIRIDVAGTPVGTAPVGEDLQYIAVFATEETPGGTQPYVFANLSRDGSMTYLVSSWTETSGLPSARIDGDDIVLSIVDDHLPAGSQMEVAVGTSMTGANEFADLVFLNLDYEPGEMAEPSFSTATGSWTERPLYQTYTLGVLDPFSIASELRGFAGDEIDRLDGIAVYQTFLTDIVFFAGAYAYSGNPLANGIGRGPLLNQPFAPTLMHMNALRYGHNATANGAMRVLLHEFGHRWLYSPKILVNGNASSILNPISAHPAQYVHTPAAFPVVTDRDTSTMGGGWFEPSGSSWATPAFQTNYGYSWLDLYLMGMADPEEVAPFFYLEGSSLGGAYYPPPSSVVSGTKRDVTIENVVGAIGPRNPSAATTKRRFRVALVVIDDAAHPFTEEDRLLVEEQRRYIESSFLKATGGRGELRLEFFAPAADGRRRGVRR